jgi:hypothetical protein
VNLTDYHAKYFAYALTKRRASDSAEKLASTLVDAQVDLNPHQVEAGEKRRDVQVAREVEFAARGTQGLRGDRADAGLRAARIRRTPDGCGSKWPDMRRPLVPASADRQSRKITRVSKGG